MCDLYQRFLRSHGADYQNRANNRLVRKTLQEVVSHVLDKTKYKSEHVQVVDGKKHKTRCVFLGYRIQVEKHQFRLNGQKICVEKCL